MDNNFERPMKNIIFKGIGEEDSDLIPIIADGGDAELKVNDLPDVLPILPLRNTVLFPGVVFPISVGRKKSLELIREVYRGNKLLGTIAQKDPEIDEPTPAELYQTGTVAQILKILEMPDGTTTVIIQGKQRYRIDQFINEDPYFTARVVG